MRVLGAAFVRHATFTFASLALVIVAFQSISAQTCNLNGTVTLNFDSVTVAPGQFVDATSYLASYGIAWSSPEAGAMPVIENGTGTGSAAIPTSAPNYFATNSAPGLNNAPLTYTLSFCNPLSSVSFSSVAVVSTSTYPTWTATAYNAQGTQVGQSVGQTGGYGTAAQQFTISGSGITSLTFVSNQTTTTFTDRPIDNLTLVSDTPAPGYSLSAGTATPASVEPGSSSSATVTVIPVNGYTGTVTLACSISPTVTGSTAPSCSFGSGTNPVDVTSDGGGATLTFMTVGPSTSSSHFTNAFYALWLPIPGLVLTGLRFGYRRMYRQRILGFFLVVAMLGSLIAFSACSSGGNSGSGGGTSNGNSGTPAGTYTITITGSDPNGVTQTGTAATVAVKVN